MFDFDELNEIEKYFHLDELNKQLEQSKKDLSSWFYSQTMLTRLEYTELGVISRGFRQDTKVPSLLKGIEYIDQRIERNELRLKYFVRYLTELPQKECDKLLSIFRLGETNKLTKKMYHKTLEEIYEIEAMICLREGIEPEQVNSYVEITEDFNENLENLCDYFAI
ncbi:hypothetical protein [Vagococcus hydrophili]|uniref:Uncharacterized protein n=1 Tax=Vagococcus hydrophili TaxID=2714947 RepID=A0A6G8ARJ8_9ENTE|nr:hypothetical protein [Vagococcus hydrophili]QIL47553.1 hypothetical protein G7082_02880 [Vagococcus hydrophili]